MNPSDRRDLALVTGANRGLGRLCALELSRAGADLLLVARDASALEAVAREVHALAPQAGVTCLPADLSLSDAPRAIAEVGRGLGGVDILVNNAAVQGPIGPTWEIDAADFEATLRLDFLSPVRLCQALIPAMRDKGRGWIVNISGGGATGPRPNFSAYGAAKTALVRFSETLAAEASDIGVRVNALAPGAFASQMSRAVKAHAQAAGESEAATAERLLAQDDQENAAKAARLVAYLTLGAGRDISGKLISAVWDPWDRLHLNPDVINNKDVFTLRRITPEDRNLSLDC